MVTPATAVPPRPRCPRLPGNGEPALVRSRAELESLLNSSPLASTDTRTVVMTMGALHAGHTELIRAARARADQLIVTIFVNPLQFGPREDLTRYPRALDADLEICAREGVDVVFAPAVVHETAPAVRVSAGPLGEVLEGATRPGHFDGVLTIVATLLNLTRPQLAFFGKKDAQQLVLVRRMVRDLAFPTEIVAVSTVRTPDGLALSSRNAYLTTRQRRTALALPRALAVGVSVADEGADVVLAAAGEVLAGEADVEVDYLTLASPHDLTPVRTGQALLLVAARVGTTRLIDNIELTLPEEDG
ncbi:pantoate--beta-alanine ligase [Candidatus Protofrankia californiensis]|uniref:pantoate--beta-alanine ligase n=1 Tax=Candidatus Protofrankia californiensis TaxID=1839754 RepID=UPI0010410E13|nr:pantoate--beta-alanine ligase [Candidatus Protofrankia californiensis]